ncbi:hypothetical protein [Caenibius sp. WL]|uniref:hypothetical protein n=1 Tax=Caenibius sp. WL TaxID=2872646 RepID=UPI001C98F1DD|nr:hypothetical protein [Caenibius sp. WL]QZP06771.1 hypothetical protein K5X80_08525 [Caenibius sp. WL]
MTAARKSLPQWRITQDGARALLRAADYAGAIARGAAIGFLKPDSICLIEDAQAARRKAIAAHRTLSLSTGGTPTSGEAA